MDDESARAVTGALTAPLADEIGLLLTTERITSMRVATPGGILIFVCTHDHARAARIIAEEYPDGPTARPMPAAEPTSTSWFGRASWMPIALLAVCTVVFAAEEFAGGSESRGVLLEFGASRPAHVRDGDWWRLVTALFVHIGPRHLLGNGLALLVLGPALAAALGAGRFALVYLVSGAAGNWLSTLVMPLDTVSAGASGAILGVLGALAGQRVRFAASARFRGWQVMAALLAYLAIAVGAEPGVDTMAHLGGLAAGLALGLVVPPLPRVPTPRDVLVSRIAGGTAALLLGAAVAAGVSQ